MGGPTRIRSKFFSLLNNQFAKFIDAEIGDQELDPRAGAIALLTETGKDARDGLRNRQQFFFGKKFFEQLRLIRDRAKAPTDVEFKTALLFPINNSGPGDGAHVVHGNKTAGVLVAAGKSDFEFTPEVLRIGMAQQKFRARLGIGRRVE